MSRVIANERLVVHEKLAALYQDKLTQANSETASLFNQQLGGLEKIRPAANPYALFRPLVLDDHVQGVVLWDSGGSVLYPRTAAVAGNDMPANHPLSEAWQQEFARQQYSAAALLYDRFTMDSDPRVAVAALAGKSRCLSKSGRLDEAIDTCQKAAFAEFAAHADPPLRLAIENARLLLLSLIQHSDRTQAHSELLHRTVGVLSADLYNPAGNQALMPANQNLFIAKIVLETLRGYPASEFKGQEARLEQLGKWTAAEELSIAAAETLRPYASQFDGFFKTVLGETSLYGLRHKTASTILLVLLSPKGMSAFLAGYQNAFNGSESAYRILDATGEFVAGVSEPKGKPFVTASLPEGFPGWKVELYFAGSDVFEKAAKRQIAVYIWTGVLVIMLILIAGGFATQAVGKQIRLNSMKNDFIATVSHELKTPLASMRVLIDTLLEGNVRDQSQVTEYLRLTAKENERLSRMIDNFLTFSRMERNKVGFSIGDARPAAIANDAVESVGTKLASHHCKLDVQIGENLPEVQADHDAIVTVLVNLLDNACKYTTDNKQVRLKVFCDAGQVCFSVSDNGIGLARRHLRRIFDRFYQVDNSLARKAEGCGLGLSIVKFIVDAHKGTISVESKPGKGSTFLVRLPVSRKNGD